MKVVISDNIKKVKQEKSKKTIKELRDELIELVGVDCTGGLHLRLFTFSGRVPRKLFLV